jgi:hypothetical protein
LSVLFDTTFALKDKSKTEFSAEREQYSWRREQKKIFKTFGITPHGNYLQGLTF